MPTVLTRPNRPASPIQSDAFLVLVGVVLFAAILAIVIPALRQPPRVDRLTIANPHPWSAEVDVTDVTRDGWLGLGSVDRLTEQTFQELIDHDDQWIFRFSYGGETAELVMDRAQLERDGWRVTVPDRLAERLRQAGVGESAG